MAKYGVTNIAGGGGVGSDEVSVTKEYVLDGKTYVGADTDDEIGAGKMANNGTTANQNLNADSSFLIKKGYHEKDFTVISNSLASQTSATALTNQIISGKTAWVNGKKITGTIPIQNSDTDGDRVWATNASNWAGTFNIGVRNGHYLNGVNWVRYDVPTYRPENIKKGVNIGGVVGTWEGWVPQPTDLYYRGNNPGNIQLGYGRFESGAIRVDKGRLNIFGGSPINMAQYSYINIELQFDSINANGRNHSVISRLGIKDKSYLSFTEEIGQVITPIVYGNYTIRIPTHNRQQTYLPMATVSIQYEWYSDNDEDWNWSNDGAWNGWVYRIWLS